jgi:hypothetical protein
MKGSFCVASLRAGIFFFQPLQVFDYAQKLIDSLPEPEVTKCKAILTDLLCPQICWDKYIHQEQQDAPVGEDDDEDSCQVDIPSGPLAEAKQNFNRATGLLLDLLLKVALGRDFFSDCQEIAATPGGLSKAMQSAEEQACSLQSTVQVPRLLKELRVSRRACPCLQLPLLPVCLCT